MMNKIWSTAMNRPTLAVLALGLGLAAAAGPALAQGPFGRMSYSEQTGAEIYTGICQGCHMPDAKGAAGAGAYPALAGDKRLTAKVYPVMVLLRGQKAMPDFSAFTDAQVANVVNYIRTNYGNHYTDTVTPDEVEAIRGTLVGK
jgi:mono/diheme cytochrome c family protein